MPFFLVAALWVLCLLLGTGLCCVTRLRALGLYILLGSTGFAVCSFLCSGIVLLTAANWPWLFRNSGLLVLGSYLVAILAGGGVGTVVGLALAFRINRWRVST
jgi:hypothetical protein